MIRLVAPMIIPLFRHCRLLFADLGGMSWFAGGGRDSGSPNGRAKSVEQAHSLPSSCSFDQDSVKLRSEAQGSISVVNGYGSGYGGENWMIRPIGHALASVSALVSGRRVSDWDGILGITVVEGSSLPVVSAANKEHHYEARYGDSRQMSMS
nr:hypothetical protein L203_03999 [Cryptococcus depauperatus CBS 7841]